MLDTWINNLLVHYSDFVLAFKILRFSDILLSSLLNFVDLYFLNKGNWSGPLWSLLGLWEES